MATNNLHVIVGLGATGLSCARYLVAQGVPVAITDTREQPPHLAELHALDASIPLKLGKLNAALLASAAKIIISPGVSLQEPLIAEQIQRGIPVVGDIELFAQASAAPIIAITGTNAKSTVTTLVGLMTEAAGYETQVGGNVGTPVLDLLNASQQPEVVVLELSSFQLETTYSLQPKVATILNITPDHMDRYATLADYQQAKQRVYQHAEIAVQNRDDALTASQTPVKKSFYFTLNKPAENEFGLLTQEGKTYLAFGGQCLMSVDELPVKGKHYQANALAALALGFAFGLDFAPMIQVLRRFQGLAHRCQFVRELDEVSWYNDSKGTNVGATLAAIQGLGPEVKGDLILIAGGVGKNADFSPLLPALKAYVRHVVLIGEAAQNLGKLFKDHVTISYAHAMDEAVAQAKAAAKPKDSVLLSPACASLDMFKNYEHRGQVFMDCVAKL